MQLLNVQCSCKLLQLTETLFRWIITNETRTAHAHTQIGQDPIRMVPGPHRVPGPNSVGLGYIKHALGPNKDGGARTVSSRQLAA